MTTTATAFLSQRANLITAHFRHRDEFARHADSINLSTDALERLLQIPSRRDIITEALGTLKDDEIVTYGLLAQLLGSTKAQGVTNIVLKAHIHATTAARVFHTPKRATPDLYAETDTQFTSHHDYQRRSTALEELGFDYTLHGDTVVLNTFTLIDVDTLAARLRYLPQSDH